jgi:hypothetical protein
MPDTNDQHLTDAAHRYIKDAEAVFDHFRSRMVDGCHKYSTEAAASMTAAVLSSDGRGLRQPRRADTNQQA